MTTLTVCISRIRPAALLPLQSVSHRSPGSAGCARPRPGPRWRPLAGTPRAWPGPPAAPPQRTLTALPAPARSSSAAPRWEDSGGQSRQGDTTHARGPPGGRGEGTHQHGRPGVGKAGQRDEAHPLAVRACTQSSRRNSGSCSTASGRHATAEIGGQSKAEPSGGRHVPR